MAEGPMSVGGQAILEGVMMRSPHSLAIAVRRPNGEIVVKEDAWHSVWERARWLRKPFLRGAVVLFESMHNGVKALSFSANEAARFVEDSDGNVRNPPARDQAAANSPDASGKPSAVLRVGSEPQVAEAEEPALSSWAIAGTIALSAVFGFGLFAALPHFVTWLAGVTLGNASLASGKDLGFQIVDGIVKIGFLVGYLALISRMKDIKRVFQYHGAEHKSIYCYEDGKALTVENARKYKTLHPRCGTSFLLVTVVVSILLFSAVFPFLPEVSSHTWLNQLAYVFIKIPLMFPVAGIAYEMTRLSARFPSNPIVRAFTWPGLMLQHITTREPDDDQLEIALVALQKTLWREECLAKDQQVAQARGHLAAVEARPAAAPEVFGTYGDFVTRLGGSLPASAST